MHYTTDNANDACPNCGSFEKTIFLDFEEGINSYELLETKEKLGGKKKYIREIKDGDEYYFKEGKYVFKERVIDRENNMYMEAIQNPENGGIIHITSEPLKQHTGHGSAKFSNKSNYIL